MQASFALLFLLFAFPLVLPSQDGKAEEMDLWLEHLVEENAAGTELDLFVKGDPERIRAFCEKEEGLFKYESRDFAAIRIPSGRVKALNEKPFVERIVAGSGKGRPLNDTAVVRNRIRPIHQGKGLPRAYEGKDVIMGYIDSGIDFEHADFQDSTGRTRVLNIWDQTFSNSNNTPSKYGYGQEWDSSHINAGNCPHVDQAGYYGHGSSVASTGSGNGLATGKHAGGAPRSDIIMVANDFDAANWTATIADGVDYILEKADSIGKPVVINTSVGTYSGSHDAKDPAAQIIEGLLDQKKGRMLVAAAGNAGHVPFHLSYDVDSDTNFTWFEYDPNSPFGYGAVFFEVWSDTAELNDVEYAVGADRVNPSFQFRGNTPFRNIRDGLDSVIADTLLNGSGDTLAIVETYGQLLGDRYKLQVHLEEPDSNDYYFRFLSTGSGRFDVWSGDPTGTSPMVDSSSTPDSSQFPDIVDYEAPDRKKTIVSSWTCSEEVLTVGNHTGRTEYTDLNGNTQNISGTQGDIAFNSSRGPTRTGLLKPDITATGKVLMTAGKLSFIDQLIQNEPYKVDPDSLHHRNGGTSIAGPVAASVSALYLQHCPQAPHQEILEAIQSTSTNDAFTGSTPNDRWGNGKLHGHNAILETLYEPELIHLGNETCDEEIPVSTQGVYEEYLWSTGDTTYSIGADSSGSYYAQVRDSSGCLALTDTVELTVHPLPPEPTVYQQGDSLFTDLQGPEHQWYRNGTLISGATEPGYRVSDSGSFYLEVEDSNGCRNYSDTLHVIPSSQKEHFRRGELSVAIHPDPVDEGGQLQLKGEREGALEYRILDLNGRKLDEGRIERGKEQEWIGMSGRRAGVYFLRWKTEQHRGTLKFIKR